MDRRGVTLIASEKEGEVKTLRLYPMGKLVPSFPTWVDHTLFDRDENNAKTKYWEKIEADPTYINTIINVMSKQNKIRLHKVDYFRANGNDVKLSQLFPNFKSHYCIFRTRDNAWSLYVVGTKSVEEISAVGLNKKNDSFMPLIVGRKEDGFKILNSI